jgi:hypothetical protein
MHKRYQKPACFFAPPSVEQLPERDAMSTEEDIAQDAEAEARRANAVDALLRFARAEEKLPPILPKDLAESGLLEVLIADDPDVARHLAQPGSRLPPGLRKFLMENGFRILIADDPVAELKRFLGRGRRRGRPADNVWRDLMITIDVQERVDSGLSVENACAAIGVDTNLSREAVEKIYYTHRGKRLVQEKPVREQFLEYAQFSERK